MLVDKSESEVKSKKLKQLSKYIKKELTALGYKGSVCMFLQPGALPVANVGINQIGGRNSAKYLYRKRRLAITDKPSKKLKFESWEQNPEAYSDEDNNRDIISDDDDSIDIIHKRENIGRQPSPPVEELETKRLVPILSEEEKWIFPEEEKEWIFPGNSSKPTTGKNTNLEHFLIIAAFTKELRDSSQVNPDLFSELKALRKRAKDIKRFATITRVELFLFLKDLCWSLRKCKATGQWNKNLREVVNKFLGTLAVAEAIDLLELVCNWCDIDLSNNWLLHENCNFRSNLQESLNILQKLPDNRKFNISEQNEMGIVPGKESQERDKPLLKKRKLRRKGVSKKRKWSRTSRQSLVEQVIQAYPQSEAFTSHDIEAHLKANKYDINMSTISNVLQQLAVKEFLTKIGKRGRFILYRRCDKGKLNAKINKKRFFASEVSQVQISLNGNSEFSETSSVSSPAKTDYLETLCVKKVWCNRNARVYDVENIYTGTVKFFVVKYGFIIPDEEIKFMGKTITPDACKKTGALYVSRDDIIFAEGSSWNLLSGDRIQFQVYSGEKGLGACRVQNEDGTAYEFKWTKEIIRKNINAGTKKKGKKKKNKTN